jgi:hypothetical protein
MKLSVMCVAFLTMVGFASVASASAPLPGNYQSNDQPGGAISPGLYTEGWAPGGGALLAGTTQNCGSWDGSSLGAEWRYTCGTQVSNGVVMYDAVNPSTGNGTRMIACTYTGGIFWLSGTGPWANGDASYPGHFDTYVEFETVQYVNWVAIGSTTTVQSSAHFDAYPQACLAFGIAGGTRMGTTVLGQVMPSYYPAMLDAACSPTMVDGAWWTMSGLTITINAACATPTKHSSWGALKAIYR